MRAIHCRQSRSKLEADPRREVWGWFGPPFERDAVVVSKSADTARVTVDRPYSPTRLRAHSMVLRPATAFANGPATDVVRFAPVISASTVMGRP